MAMQVDHANAVDHVGDDKILKFYALCVAGKYQGTFQLVKPEKILYAFLAGAVGDASDPMSGRINAIWRHEFKFANERVYIRTIEGVYQSGVRTLARFLEISPPIFLKAGQSVIVNVGRVDNCEFEEAVKTLWFKVHSEPWSRNSEWVVIGKTFVSRFRFLYGVGRDPGGNVRE